MFIDRAEIRVQAGNGGSGCASFRREKYIPKGGPSGGDGGNGGDVILVADSNLTTLLDFKYKPNYKAGRAQHGRGSNQHGKNGEDLLIRLPCGTIVKDAETEELLGDLVNNGQKLVVARGGRGGKGNARFVSPTNRAPREWEPGAFGERRTLHLELKLIADVGLVGLPNAGKSTLISRISAATPKIADYPFTTLKPNLGLVRYRDTGSFVVADIPGIIEGAHHGKGLGLDFLRHVERTRIILVLIDCMSEAPLEDFKTLTGELERYNPLLKERVAFVVLTKIDLQPEREHRRLEKAFPAPSLAISSVTGEGLEELTTQVWETLSKLRDV